MKHANAIFNTTLLSIGLLMAMPTQAQVYECRDSRGHPLYTEQPSGSHCQAVSIRNTGTFSAVPTYQAPSATPSDHPETAAKDAANAGNHQAAQIQAARQQLQAAQQALEEGKKVRYGNERNYAKYLARIQGLEDVVKAKQQALQQLQHLQ